jgi:cardiolipin synthase
MIHQTPLWLTAIVIGRDIAIILGIALAKLLSLPLKVEALVVGKASTVVQVGYVGLVLLLLTFNVVMPQLATAAAVITAGFAVLSGLAYAQLLLKALAPGRRPA